MDITLEELQKLSEERFATFASEGWKDFIATMKLSHQRDSDIASIKTPEELYKRQGRLEVLGLVLAWESLCRDILQRAEAQAEDDEETV